MVAYSTGLRAQECASLTPESFRLDRTPPDIVLECTISKRRRYDVQEIQPDLAGQLLAYLRDKPRGTRVWPGAWWRQAAKMLRVDLKAAGIPYKTADGYADFHAGGRHSFITNVGHTKASISLIQRICRLSTPALLDNYFHVDDAAQSAVIGALPKLPHLNGSEAKAS